MNGVPMASEEVLASRAIDRCLRGQDTPVQQAQAIAGAFGRFEHTISDIIGAAGFRAVLARSIHLSESHFPWLSSGETDPQSIFSISSLTASMDREGPAAVRAGATMILGKVLGLLSNFIGHDLTLRLLQRSWPDVGFENLPRGSE